MQPQLSSDIVPKIHAYFCLEIIIEGSFDSGHIYLCIPRSNIDDVYRIVYVVEGSVGILPRTNDLAIRTSKAVLF